MFEHTPGPWGALKYSDANCVATITGVWTVVSIGADPNQFDAKADACLIAAAPDMLEALETLLEEGDTNSTAVLCAEQAVAKAKGETK